MRTLRRFLPFILRSVDGAIALCVGLLIIFRLRARIVMWARDLATHVPSKLEPLERVHAIEAAIPSATYLVASLVFVLSTTLAALALRGLDRFSFKRRVTATVAFPLIVAVCVSARGIAPFWMWAAIAMIVALSPLFSRSTTIRPRTPSASATRACVLGAELGCTLLAFALTLDAAGPFYIPAFGLGFAVGALIGSAQPELTDSLSRAALPVLLLPLVGLRRAPSLKATLWVVMLVPVIFAVARRWPRIAEALSRSRDRWGIDVALVSTTFALVIPWRFRELSNADFGGHEGQHLGWINSIVHGRMMMADAGFIYGPLREYLLALIAWLFGGLTLEHVRLAQITVNLVGLLLLVAAARRASRNHLATTALGLVLLLAHSAIIALINYTNTIGFGWVDELRSGLAVFAVVIALGDEQQDSRWRLRAGGVLGGLAALYSHDFGVLAVIGTVLGLTSELLGRRAPLRVRFFRSAKRLGDYLGGVLVPIGLFIVVYACAGRLGALWLGARWSIRVGAGLLQSAIEPYPIDTETLIDSSRLFELRQEQIGTSTCDYLIILVIPLVAVASVIASAIQGRWTRRSSFIFGLAAFVALTMRHPLVSADGWHVANASGGCVVLVVAMIEDAGRFQLPGRVRIGAWFAAFFAASWLLLGAARPLAARLSRLSNGDERPSSGQRYAYEDLPRAGDLLVDGEHLAIARYTLAHTSPQDRILATTWLLGGGTEAFLANRQNAVPFDVPHECQTPAQREEALAALKSGPPTLIIGSYMADFGPDVAEWVKENYVVVSVPGTSAPIYVRRER